ncbi:terminal uridylyltransferase 4-like [Hetaerina americana]|uniref:terminal uridylyltransferase 4-like n=1 Tax=Hetaerina americana TaxID=62018 RepID=UPI003A7F3E14
MASVIDKETRGGEAKIAPLLEKLPENPIPGKNTKSAANRDKVYLKADTRYFRQRRGKSTKLGTSRKAEGNGPNISKAENTLSPPTDIIHVDSGENQANVTRAKKLHKVSKVSTPKSHVTPLNAGDKPSIEMSYDKPISNNVKVQPVQCSPGEKSCDTDKKVDQENVVKEPTNCQLHDPNAIFNELCYEDKLFLQSNHIEVLKKKSDKYPLAVFHCTLCRFYSSTIAICRAHAKNNNHASDLKEKRLLETVRLIPPATPEHIHALDQMVIENVAKLAMGESEREICLQVVQKVSTFVAEKFPGCSLTLYGSVATRLALKESNIDLNLNSPSTVNGPTTLAAIANAMSLNPNFRDVEKDFDEGRPSIHFIDQNKNVKCCICLSKEETLKTTEIIAKYQTIDPRFQQLAIIFHKWAKLCKIDDYKNGMWPPHTFPLLLIYYLQQCEPPVLPVLHELKGDPEDDNYLEPSELDGKWQGQNKMSVGNLWLGLLRFYAIDYAHSERVVCIRKRAPLKRTVKNWIGKRTAIEDPFSVKRNVSRTIIHNFSFKYIMTCFRKSYLYYGIPLTSRGHLYANIQPSYPKLESNEEHLKMNSALSQYLLKICRKNDIFCFEDLPSTEASASECNDSRLNAIAASKLAGEKSKYVVAEELSLEDAILFSNHIRSGMIQYDFVAENGNKIPPTICAICSNDGHSKSQCPDARLPPLEQLPPMTEAFMSHINDFCEYVYDNNSQNRNDIMTRKLILNQLQGYLSAYYPDVQLSLFGSSSNGFGFRNSDIDICLTFKGNSTGQGIDVAKLIPELVYRLRKMPEIRNIVPIPSAKVPIIKFKHIQTHLEGDISLYNTLAQHNTQLLKTYSLIDNRVKVLGYVMKAFAKLCDIRDASRGSLSSYGYILMVIYFLQHCNPPVVPVLQELSDIHPTPENIQEGQNVWFFRDLDRLGELWPEYGKNELSVGQLWLQLLCFYTEEFDFEQHVISIKQKQILYKFDKMWFKKPMAIEDPFDIQHNLAGALSRKMKLFIIKSLRKGRHHFGTPVVNLPPPVKSWKEYFLNGNCLREGAPPNNGCHICKKIGHKVRNCPERGKFSKERRNDGEHREAKNAPAHTNQQIEYRRRPPVQAVNQGGMFRSRVAPLLKEEQYPPQRFPVPQQHHVRIPFHMQNQPHQEWFQQHWQNTNRNMAAPVMMWPPGMMAGGVRPSDNVAMVNSMPTCAALERDMTKGTAAFSKNTVFRSADPRQMYHEPCLPLSQYRRPVGCDDKLRHAQVDGQKLFSGAIPKTGPSNSSTRPRYSGGQKIVNGPN